MPARVFDPVYLPIAQYPNTIAAFGSTSVAVLLIAPIPMSGREVDLQVLRVAPHAPKNSPFLGSGIRHKGAREVFETRPEE